MLPEMEGDISNVPRWDDMSPEAQPRETYHPSRGHLMCLPTLRATFIISYQKSIIMKYGI
jgi:hypothetical protein